MGFDLVAIGASWGGLDALTRVLTALPEDFPAAVAIVQHRDENESPLASLLGHRASLPVREANDKERIEPGVLFVAPPNYHLLVESGAFALSTDERVQFSRPSIDVLFESAADEFHERVIGVVLTGANADGALGLARIKARGGIAIVQDPASARRSEMPDAAIAACTPDAILDVDDIAARLIELCGTHRTHRTHRNQERAR